MRFSNPWRYSHEQHRAHKGVTSAAPGSAQRLYLVVSDVEAARATLIARGAEVGEVFHRLAIGGPTASGVDSERRSYNSFATFNDPDHNVWLLQEVTARRPDGSRPATRLFASAADLALALRRAAIAHGEHEKRDGGSHDENSPDWYATYIVAEREGKLLPL